MSPTRQKNSTQMGNMKFCSHTDCIALHLGAGMIGRLPCFRALGMVITSLSNHGGDGRRGQRRCF